MGSLSFTTVLIGLTLCQTGGQVASGEQPCLGVFMLGTGSEHLFTLMDLGGISMKLMWSVGTGLGRGSMEPAQSVGECPVILAVILLTAVLTSCPSSFLKTASSSSNDSKSSNGGGRTGEKRLDNMGAVLGIGKN